MIGSHAATFYNFTTGTEMLNLRSQASHCEYAIGLNWDLSQVVASWLLGGWLLGVYPSVYSCCDCRYQKTVKPFMHVKEIPSFVTKWITTM